jgi:chaperone required for assembly of F1-ATPase
MPLSQILTTKIDRIARERQAIHALLMKYLDTDLLCYRTSQPPEMAQNQKETWDPWLDWFEQEFGLRLLTTEDLRALKQPDAAYQAVETRIKDLDDEQFTILQLVTSSSGSLVLGLAFIAGKATPDDVFEAARVEESFKAELYNEKTHGPDPAEEKKDAAIKADLIAAAKYLDLLS